MIEAPDGSSQWAYRGQGLFGYALDQKPGDAKGEYLFSYYKVDSAGKITNIANVRSGVDVPVSWRPAFPCWPSARERQRSSAFREIPSQPT